MINVEVRHKLEVLRSAGITADAQDIVSKPWLDAKQKIQTGTSCVWTPGGRRVFRNVCERWAGDLVELCRKFTHWDLDQCVSRARAAEPSGPPLSFYAQCDELWDAIQEGREAALDHLDKGHLEDNFGDWSIIDAQDFSQCFPDKTNAFPRSGPSRKKKNLLMVRPLMDPLGQWAGLSVFKILFGRQNKLLFIGDHRFEGFSNSPLIAPGSLNDWPSDNIVVGYEGRDAGIASAAGLRDCFEIVDIGGWDWNGNWPQEKVFYISIDREIPVGTHFLSATTSVTWMDRSLAQRLTSAGRHIASMRVPFARACAEFLKLPGASPAQIFESPMISTAGRSRLFQEFADMGDMAPDLCAQPRQFECDGWMYFTRNGCVWKVKSNLTGKNWSKVRHPNQVTNFVIIPDEDVIVDNQVAAHVATIAFDNGQSVKTVIPASLFLDAKEFMEYVRLECIKRGLPRPAVFLPRERQMLPTIFEALYIGAPKVTYTPSRGQPVMAGASFILKHAGHLCGEDFLRPADHPRFLSEHFVREVVRVMGMSHRLNEFGRGLRMIHPQAEREVLAETEERGWVIPPATQKEKKENSTKRKKEWKK